MSTLYAGTIFLAVLLFSRDSPPRGRTSEEVAPSVTKIVLEDSLSALPGAQSEAEAVTREVDHLIPGRPSNLRDSAVLITAIPTCATEGKYPVTVEGPRQPEETLGVDRYEARIYLCGVSVGHTIYSERFAYQLGHELAHVKMGALTDNYLQETFAVAVSFQVLKAFNCFNYLNEELRKYADSTPLLKSFVRPPTKDELNYAALYWQLSIASLEKPDPKTNKWSYSSMTLAVLIMDSGDGRHIPWPSLLDLSRLSIGPVLVKPAQVPIRAPDLPQITQRIPVLCNLGYVCR